MVSQPARENIVKLLRHLCCCGVTTAKNLKFRAGKKEKHHLMEDTALRKKH
jgi:hypothetical protein